ncbi:MAG: ABC transporter permease [Faecousia sp.]
MTTTTKTKTSSPLTRMVKRSEFTIGLVVIALFLLAFFGSDTFKTQYNLMNLTKQGAIVGVLAVAQTLIIITGGIDISGGAIAGLGCMTMALMIRAGQPVWLAIILNFVVCIVCGFINGVIIFDLNVPAMIATLGTQTIYRGILKLACSGNSVSFFEADGKTFIKLFEKIGDYNVFGFLPILACIWILVAIIAFLVLRYTVFGRDLFVIGSGIEVARLSGIKVRKTFYMVYSVAGLIYGVAAMMFAGRILRAMPNTGEGYDMNAIAAAVIGGASLAGGRGAITGTFIGTLLMAVIENAGKSRPFGIEISDYILEVITGILIIAAVAMDMIKTRKKA